MYRISIIILLALGYMQLLAQNWVSVDTGFNYHIDRLVTDTFRNRLYAIGSFTNAGGTPARYIAQYDGTKWDSISFIKSYSRHITPYGSTLIFGTNPLMRWNGFETDTLSVFSTPRGVTGSSPWQGKLLVYGNFDSIGGIASNDMAIWDGNTWLPFGADSGFADFFVRDAIEYNGDLYVCGNIWNNSGTIERVARWKEGEWKPAGNGIRGSLGGVGNFRIYNGDLYMGGTFSKQNGNPGNSIIRWNGMEWNDVGGGVSHPNSSIGDMAVYDGKLYAAGGFAGIGGMPIRDIAKWDGEDWCGLGQITDPPATIGCIEVYNGELYAAGYFKVMDGDTVNYIAKWVGGNYTSVCGAITDVPGIDENPLFTLYPNPATNQLNCTLPSNTANAQYAIYNMQGAVVVSSATSASTFNIDVSMLHSGIYYIVIQGKEQRYIKRFVKQ